MTESSGSRSTALSVYSLAQVEQAAEMLQLEIRAGDGWARLAGFVFRHGSGAWWTCCPRTGQWQRSVQGRWVAGGPPEGALIGSDWVGHLAAFGGEGDLIDDGESDISALDDDQGGDGDQALAMVVAGIRDSFAAGRLDSHSAELALRRLYLLDEQWRVWTVGVRSGRWYRLDSQGWVPGSEAPEGTPAEGEADHSRRVFEAQLPIFNGDAPALPEAIVPDWQPPQGLQPAVEPEEQAPCGGCNDRPGPPSAAAVDSPPRRSRTRIRILVISIAALLVPAAIALGLWLDYNVFVTADELYERGDNFRTGWKAEQNPARAYKWLHKARMMGHAAATYSLGRMYQDGMGVERDYQEAFNLYMDAATNYNADAMLALAEMYDQGLHVTVDHRKAREWRERARMTRARE